MLVIWDIKVLQKHQPFFNLAPKTYRRYLDDSRVWSKSKEQSCEFQHILNKQDKYIQFTIEDENEEKCLNFLDRNIRTSNGRYELDVHCKPAQKMHKLSHILVYPPGFSLLREWGGGSPFSPAENLLIPPPGNIPPQ